MTTGFTSKARAQYDYWVHHGSIVSVKVKKNLDTCIEMEQLLKSCSSHQRGGEVKGSVKKYWVLPSMFTTQMYTY